MAARLLFIRLHPARLLFISNVETAVWRLQSFEQAVPCKRCQEGQPCLAVVAFLDTFCGACSCLNCFYNLCTCVCVGGGGRAKVEGITSDMIWSELEPFSDLPCVPTGSLYASRGCGFDNLCKVECARAHPTHHTFGSFYIGGVGEASCWVVI